MSDTPESPEQLAARAIAEQDQAAAALRGLAEAAVTARRTLVEGGVSGDVADQMVLRFWLSMFPGPNLLGQIFGGPPA